MDKWEVYDEVRRLQMELVKVDSEGWNNNEFLTWQWWLLLAILIVPWIIYIVIHKRERIVSTFLVGIFVALASLILDVMGSDLDFWGYPTELFSPGPGAIPFDLGIVTVAYMILYQYFPTWKKYIIALIILAVFFAYIGASLAIMWDLYRKIEWKAIYSLGYYLAIGIFVKAFVDKLVKMEKRVSTD